jgi:hypothetical protein
VFVVAFWKKSAERIESNDHVIGEWLCTKYRHRHT